MYTYVEHFFQYIIQTIINFLLYIYSFITYNFDSIYNSKIISKRVSWNPELYKIDYTYSKEDYDRSRYKPMTYYLF